MMKANSLHQEVCSVLKSFLTEEDGVLAAWEGGAVATGFADEYSDLDLIIVTRDSIADELFEKIEKVLSAKYGIKRKFRMPEPAWHGLSQCFYLLDRQDGFFYCDIAIADKDKEDKLTESDRHGIARIWFDKANIYHSQPSSPEQISALGKRIYGSICKIDFIMLIELDKALARKNFLAAQMQYQQVVNRILVPLLNLKYRPAKADFGIRYAEREYPPEAAEELASLLKYGGLEEILYHTTRVKSLYQELKSELAASYQ
ncbi:MAG: nucleotidyltransferase domain-containing protein [Candidatus Cloacimonetes bacterium]|nr:nucleotidyltransferase domain-containing protein [Candidatus Cloacimonadota bacterium]